MSTAVANKIESILRQPYDTIRYVELIQEIFPNVHLIAPDKINKEFSNFSSHIESSAHVGTFQTPDKKKIIIMSVQLKKEGYIESSRSIQRNYAKKLIENGNADAAFIAFYTSVDTKWRLSLVRLDYEMKIENGRLKTAENLTPAKRYSYLVGPEEPCHTAISRFNRYITDSTVRPEYPTLDDLEEAFSVEKVTNEFFQLYCEKFHQLREQLEAIEDFRIEAQQHSFTSAQFAKKLMGQIVFLYFLQKKGWLGVKAWPDSLTKKEYNDAFYARGAKSRELLPFIYLSNADETYHISPSALNSISKEDKVVLANCVTGLPWGTGPRDFMRAIFDTAIEQNINFYNDLLEPLFYSVLSKNRGAHGYCAELDCRIPFLSGGLFEPIDGYDWEHSNFHIPNEVFSNIAEKGREADGILDVFDRYNFTISEDEPLEREVAIDPEMLGKVFENLLEVKDRKSMGAYYTPREIVLYMCQESLINYLVRKTGITRKDIEDFVANGDIMKDVDIDRAKQNSKDKLWIPQSIYEQNEAGRVITNNLDIIDHALATVCIVDPAVGSGAFPLCMVNEIVKLRHVISTYQTLNMDQHQKDIYYMCGRTTYQLKYNTIKNCIYGVDIDPSAVDIACLRLWLSLVIEVDSEHNLNDPLNSANNPPTLPNLENNIICSNSLIDRFGDLGIFCENGVIGTDASVVQNNMHTPLLSPVFQRLFAEQDQLFSCDDPLKKNVIKSNIFSYKSALVRHTVGPNIDISSLYNKHNTGISKAVTLWQLEFAKVFYANGGFDIVIGNPPYVQLQKNIEAGSTTKVGDQYSHLEYQTFAKSGDLYCLFYELGIKLLCNKGCLSFISSNKWMRTAYGEQLRLFFANNTNPKVLIDFSGTRVFETAGVDVSILLLEKDTNAGNTTVCTIKEPCGSNLSAYVKRNAAILPFLNGEAWNILPNIESNIKKKILAVGKPLADWKISIKYGIKTCLNKVYVIDEQTKRQLCELDPASEEILQPVLRGRDIEKWKCNYRNLWLIAVHNGIHKYHVPPIDINKYNAVREYLTPHMDDLKKRIDQGVTPYHLKNCTYYEEYSMPKIVFQEIEQSPSFALDSEGKYMCLDTVRIITGERLEYLTALLNSNLFFFAVKHFFGGGALGEKGVRMKHTFFKAFTAYVPSKHEEQFIKSIVTSDREDKDNAINEFFYQKYRISADEIAYIETDIK